MATNNADASFCIRSLTNRLQDAITDEEKVRTRWSEAFAADPADALTRLDHVFRAVARGNVAKKFLANLEQDTLEAWEDAQKYCQKEAIYASRRINERSTSASWDRFDLEICSAWIELIEMCSQR